MLVSSIVLLIVFIIIYLFMKINKSEKNTNTKAIKQLSDHEYYSLQRIVPTAQLEVLDNVLLVSMGLIYDLLKNIKSDHKEKESVFEEKLTSIITLFKKINQRPEFISSTVTKKSRNNAILIFSFYRILFSQVLEKAISQKILNKSVDPFILLKRIPPKVFSYLGSQYWRVYELKMIISGDLNHLTLNQDIQGALIDLCDENADVLNNKILEKEVSQENHIDQNLYIHFIKWLQRELARSTVNKDKKFYCDVLSYGKKTIFISDIGLSGYAKNKKISITELKNNLQISKNVNDSQFNLEGESLAPISLIKINIDFDIEVINTLTGNITRIDI